MTEPSFGVRACDTPRVHPPSKSSILQSVAAAYPGPETRLSKISSLYQSTTGIAERQQGEREREERETMGDNSGNMASPSMGPRSNYAQSQGLKRKQPGLVCASAVIKRGAKKGINDLIEEERKKEGGNHTDSGSGGERMNGSAWNAPGAGDCGIAEGPPTAKPPLLLRRLLITVDKHAGGDIPPPPPLPSPLLSSIHTNRDLRDTQTSEGPFNPEQMGDWSYWGQGPLCGEERALCLEDGGMVTCLHAGRRGPPIDR
ncbi:unnamed protein product [Pleuronectes platessa]|uniref:Uncharacterized protein n=1 Tax=Pleuronectes platessa TaxID=8262 RepID=A0A9N7YS56_PLEPL|nr:unnamed protein product [Pleuronectes platessa]